MGRSTRPSPDRPTGSSPQPIVRVLPTAQAVAEAAADVFVQSAHEAVTQHGAFNVALSGGSTPKAMHQLLAAEPRRSQVDWSKVHIFFGDERCVPPEHPESNYAMARQTLLSLVPIPDDHIHRMRGEIDPNAAAKEYGLMLQSHFGEEEGLDLLYLGMGQDGHTLSLFPGTAAIDETHHRVVANYAEHSTTGKSWRITMTAPFANRSKLVAVMVTGAGKAGRVKQVLEGPRQPQVQPIQLIQPTAGQLVWLMDVAAAGMNGD